ncbi:GNAT family N-acetyltransferase [Methylophilus sp. UBA6697]|jgi:ribosomal protein S18 acetylase RimI-like enzyme|uniref:GNAT family N-acetyltransferase n=1 Tax=Methylophilus sp. UBA6697 TaxID=1946902 RepID=UPI000EE80F36|nr:GNAT family N-acetyltransferase [Methylophilus sp. UBA6697]HCU85491.1 GNAT family N-acetyltransferase [Methylophilus sp.]
MTYEIKPISEHDIDGFAAAVDSVARELKYLSFTEGPPHEMTVNFVRKNIAGHWPHFIALYNQQVVGWCDIASLDRPVYAHAGVLGIGVVRRHRQQGIGKRLMQAALEAACASGLTRITLTVREHNDVAIKLYEQFGFLKEGLHINAVKVNEHYENYISMALLL